jgi:hypothetical protein
MYDRRKIYNNTHLFVSSINVLTEVSRGNFNLLFKIFFYSRPFEFAPMGSRTQAYWMRALTTWLEALSYSSANVAHLY